MKIPELLELTKLFVDEYKNPIILTPTQQEIFMSILTKKHSRVGVITPTQYGKSLTTALALILRVITLPEKWIIVGGTEAKAEIIMGYFIDHLFDSKIFLSQLEVEGGKLEQLRRERRRDHLTFKRGGEVLILSAEYRNRKRLGEALIGFGAQNLVIDDSCLCDDDQYAFIKRMVGGRKNTFILELSNPLRRNHFYKTMVEDKKYYKIWIDYKIALQEGRYSEDFIEEMRSLPYFKQLYECKFPEETEIDEKGYLRLLTDEQIEKSIAVFSFDDYSPKILGVDIARGGNYNVFCVRQKDKAKIVYKDRNPDLMSTAGKIIQIMREFEILPKNVFIDDTGIGGGVVARLKEQNFYVNGVLFGESSENEYAKNKRAEMYFRLRNWILQGGKIEYDERLIQQLKIIKYRTDSSGKLQIQPKQELISLGYESPDEVDALALTFAEEEIEEKNYEIFSYSFLETDRR